MSQRRTNSWIINFLVKKYLSLRNHLQIDGFIFINTLEEEKSQTHDTGHLIPDTGHMTPDKQHVTPDM